MAESKFEKVKVKSKTFAKAKLKLIEATPKMKTI